MGEAGNEKESEEEMKKYVGGVGDDQKDTFNVSHLYLYPQKLGKL